MKILFNMHSLVVNILATLIRSIVFNISFIIIFGAIYAFLATDKMPLDDYFILSARTQFLIHTPTDDLNAAEKNVLHIQKVLVAIGFALIILRFLINLFK
jgi:hypothetical protein